MIFYSWIALGQSDPAARNETDPIAPDDSDRPALSFTGRGPWSGPRLDSSDQTVLSRIGRAVAGGASWADTVPVAMGITDDRGRAMRAGEEILGTGRAAVVIIEAVRPGMAAHTLAPCYVRTGVGWAGRPAAGGEVSWVRFFL